MDNKIIQGLITAIWTHGHGIGCKNWREYGHRPPQEIIKQMTVDLASVQGQWTEEITNVLILLMAQIPQYITKKSETNGFDFHYYLHIGGGTGINPARPVSRSGGEFNVILYYAAPSEIAHKGETCDRLWCIQNNIEYGEGETIYHAYMDYLTKIKK
jgi:hypothetical protein